MRNAPRVGKAPTAELIGRCWHWEYQGIGRYRVKKQVENRRGAWHDKPVTDVSSSAIWCHRLKRLGSRLLPFANRVIQWSGLAPDPEPPVNWLGGSAQRMQNESDRQRDQEKHCHQRPVILLHDRRMRRSDGPAFKRDRWTGQRACPTLN